MGAGAVVIPFEAHGRRVSRTVEQFRASHPGWVLTLSKGPDDGPYIVAEHMASGAVVEAWLVAGNWEANDQDGRLVAASRSLSGALTLALG